MSGIKQNAVIFSQKESPVSVGLSGSISVVARNGSLYGYDGITEKEIPWSSSLDSRFISVTGDSMSGALVIGNDPGGDYILRIGGTMTVNTLRDSVVGIDFGNFYEWTISNVPVGSFPLLGVYRIINNSTNTPNPGDHSVSLISLAEDSINSKLNMLAGESRVNARGTAQYVGHNSKLTYRQSGNQFPEMNGYTSCAHWADVQMMQSDNVTPLISAGIYTNCYIATPIVGGDPLLRASYRGSDRFITTSTTNGSSTDGAITAPNGGIQCGANAYIGGSVTAASLNIGGGALFGAGISLSHNTNTILSANIINNNSGNGAAALVAFQNDVSSTAYMGIGSSTFNVLPGASGAFFIYSATGIVCIGSTVTVNSLTIGGNQVVGARSTGWVAQTATPSKADLGATPTVGQLASFCVALKDALVAHGLIGT
jgi:hypothetical protein